MATISAKRYGTFGLLLIAIIAVSWSAIFVRWCGDTPAMIIAFYRLFWATILMFFLSSRSSDRNEQWRSFSAKQRILVMFSGLMLALHFATWIYSLQLTTIAHALTLSSTHPVMALLLSPLILQERGNRLTVIAVLLAIAGTMLIATQDGAGGDTRLGGDLLALASAFFVTVYFLIGRYLRATIDLRFYLFLVYGGAAVMLALFSLFAGHPFIDYPAGVHIMMLLLALIPTGIGHSLLNMVTRRIPVYEVNLALLGEPILSSIMAFIFFSEAPGSVFYLGAAIIFAGIILAIRRS